MGLFDSFFTDKSKSTSTTKYEPGKWQKQGMNFFSDLLGKDVPQYPTMEIEGLTPFQQSIQGYLQNALPASQNNYRAAMDETMRSVRGEYDPITSPYYQGFRQQAEDLKAESANTVRQRSQMAGMLNSSPSIGMESQSNRQYDSMILQELGKLYESERNRKMQASGMVPGMEAQNIQNMAGASDFANVPRQIEQMRNEQNYQAAMNEMLFPYTVQANIANALTSSNWGATITGETTQSSTPSMFSQLASIAGAGTGIASGVSGMNLNRQMGNMYQPQAGYYNSLY